jgi:hypothetical protein
VTGGALTGLAIECAHITYVIVSPEPASAIVAQAIKEATMIRQVYF